MKRINAFLMAPGTILPRICAVRIGRHFPGIKAVSILVSALYAVPQAAPPYC